MTEDNGKKLTLSRKSTLTLKKPSLSTKPEGKKMVQVEVRKKRFVTQTAETNKSVEIDQATAQKLELLAKAKEHDARRKQEEEEKALIRQKQKEEKERQEAEALKKKQEEEKIKQETAKKEAKEKPAPVLEPVVENDSRNHKHKDKKEDFDDEDDFYSKKGKKNISSETSKPLTKEETFEQERKKIQKRSFETPKRNNKLNVNSICLMMTMMRMITDMEHLVVVIRKKRQNQLYNKHSHKKKSLKKLLFLRLSQCKNLLIVWLKRALK